MTGGPAVFWDEALRARWLAAARGDAELGLAARGADLRLDLVRDGRACRLRFGGDGFAPVDGPDGPDDPDGPDGPAPVLRVSGDADAWSRFLAPVPARFHTDVVGMSRRGCGFVVSGDQSSLHRYPHVLHRAFALAREVGVG